MKTLSLSPANCFLFFIAALPLTGCGQSGPPSLADYANSNIKKLRGAYAMYAYAHELRGPQSEEDFKEYLTTDPGAIAKMDRVGVPEDKILGIFVSERDGKPFKIRYGLNGLADHAVIFESEGVDGKRFVAFTIPREVENEEYEKLIEGKIKPESPLDDLSKSPQ